MIDRQAKHAVSCLQVYSRYTFYLNSENTATNFVYVASAMLLWQLFSNVFNDVSNSIIGNSNLFSKVYFPKIIIPISTILVCLIDFLISLIILIVLFIIAGQTIHWHIILAPLFILLTLINGFGIGLYNFILLNVIVYCETAKMTFMLKA